MSQVLQKRKWYSGMKSTEDWWAVWLSFFFIILALFSLLNIDLVGWIAYPTKWVAGGVEGKHGFWNALNPLGASYKDAGLGFWGSLFISYICISIPMMVAAWFMKWDLKKFFSAWTIIFFLTYIVWILGNHAFLSANETNKAKYGMDTVLSLGGGGAYILMLIVGLIIGNFFIPFANFLKPAAKPELYIKIAIVFLGVKVGYLAFKASGFMFELAIAGAAATIVAYLIFWPGVYLMCRKLFKLPMKTSAVISSGISICGVSAAIATAGAVRAKPLIPIMVSALIVVFAVIELVIIPPAFTATMIEQPIVAGAAMGMAIKTDGADAAAGAIMDEMMRNKKVEMDGTVWEEGFITTSAIMTKIWIDMFIGVWAFVLAMIWVYKIDRTPGERVLPSEMWHRFPKFVLGYFMSWFLFLGILFILPDVGDQIKVGAVPVEKGMRGLFFMLTFLSIGVITDFKKLAEARFGKMVFAYIIALFAFIIPVAIAVAWIFHHGMQVPILD
jgi:uncharacterized membrane protein YadS